MGDRVSDKRDIELVRVKQVIELLDAGFWRLLVVVNSPDDDKNKYSEKCPEDVLVCIIPIIRVLA